MSQTKLNLRYMLIPAFGVGLIILSYFFLRSFLTQTWNCEVKSQIHAHHEYIKIIENKFKNEIYFWAWIKHEGFMPADIQLPAEPNCAYAGIRDFPIWTKAEFWNSIYTSEYRMRIEGLMLVDRFNQSVFSKINDFEKRRGEWWQSLRSDILKICSLQSQVKRLSEVKTHLLASCRMPATVSPVSPCLKELKNMEKLIEREEKPFKENRDKMKTKWPYLEEIFNREDINCDV